ncbi:hypothetical protein FAD_1415 [Ferroplasma acidiphilum]|uniref:Uncharacterized protein n=1 Tax=Ferroplasma acidiphilum TaxID=74969 RepID=A0A1V0N599_9ARCH|nr:hypothetical protein [Ferroplasma acidiphilum]ARD85274.1 hypothetical protein FAD_1415 [Ferroplasma acidiphilum]
MKQEPVKGLDKDTIIDELKWELENNNKIINELQNDTNELKNNNNKLQENVSKLQNNNNGIKNGYKKLKIEFD